MALLGQAAVAMWWDIAPAHRAEFEDWHSHEHLPERLGIPGFRRGSRWADAAGGDGYFVLYELERYETLTSPHYLARLNDPTPWSAKMMPHHRNMVRSQCRVLESCGGGIAKAMLTLRLAPNQGGGAALREHLRDVLAAAAAVPGVTGGHLLATDTPEMEQTAEQRIRGGDAVADWIVLLSGYDEAAIAGLGARRLAADMLLERGARAEQTASLFRLRHAMTPGDLSPKAPPRT